MKTIKIFLFLLVISFLIIILGFLVSSAQSALPTVCKNSSYVDEKSILIINGVIQKSYSDFSKEGDLVYTYTTISIKKVIRGSFNGSTIETKNLGGIMNTSKMFIDDLSDFEVGDQGVFYIKKFGATLYYEITCNKYGYKPCENLNLQADYCSGGTVTYEENEFGCYQKANCAYSCDQKCQQLNYPGGSCTDKTGTLISSSECNECYCQGKNYTCPSMNIDCGSFQKIEYRDEKECKKYYCANETSEKYCSKNSECDYKGNAFLDHVCMSDCFNKNMKVNISCKAIGLNNSVCGCIKNVCQVTDKNSLVIVGNKLTDFSCTKNSDCNLLSCVGGEVNCVDGKCKSEKCQEVQEKKTIKLGDIFSSIINFFRKLFKK